MKTKTRKFASLAVASLLVVTLGTAQIMQVIKVLGVGAAVKQFGPEINRALNKLTRHQDTYTKTTKVVPILAVGLGQSSAIGAAQVMGPKDKVDQVQAVASPETKLFGEIRIRAMIPVSSRDVIKDIKVVDGVGVSGIVDLKL